MGALKRKLKTMFTTKRAIWKWFAKQPFFKHVPDKSALKILYKNVFNKKLNLKNPETFNEKLQWLKLYDRNPLYTTLVDKYAVKEYVAKIIGEEHIIPTLGVWDKFDDIDFNALPDKFVLKCTHSSGDIIICKDKKSFDKEAAKKKIESFLKKDFYKIAREWTYKNVPRRIIAEQYMEDETGELRDYKFFCFNGKAYCVMVCLDRCSGDTKFYFFDRDWNLKRFNKRGKEAPNNFTIPKPLGIDEMFITAEKLASDIPFVRVDLYQINGLIYFGEMTFFPTGGFDSNLLPETDLLFGSQIILPNKRK